VNRCATRATLAAFVLTLACAQPAALAPRVVHGLDDAPYLGADSVVVSVERAGVQIDGASVRIPHGATSFELEGVPFGEDLALRVESRIGDVVLARGRSFPFDYAAADRPPSRAPDVFLGTLGRFARPLETDRTIVALAPTTDGALLATIEGEILAYEAHGAPDGSARLVPLGTVPERAGASWAALDPPAGHLLGVGGAERGASLVDASGRVVASLDASAFEARSEIALAAADDTSWVIAVGGRDDGGSPVTDVVRIDVGESTLSASPAAALDTPRAGASAVRVDATDGAITRDVVLVVGGGAPGVVALLDLEAATTLELAVDRPLEGRALIAVETGLVVAAGGADALGAPSDAVDLFLVRLDPSPDVARFSPAPSPLYAPRAHAVVIALGPGLALFVGGTGTAGAPVAGAELVEVRLDTLPGRIFPTGTLPAGATAWAGARLADRSVLVVGGGLLSVYVPPRGPI
jgi:hypothetical protein